MTWWHCYFTILYLQTNACKRGSFPYMSNFICRSLAPVPIWEIRYYYPECVLDRQKSITIMWRTFERDKLTVEGFYESGQVGLAWGYDLPIILLNSTRCGQYCKCRFEFNPVMTLYNSLHTELFWTNMGINLPLFPRKVHSVKQVSVCPTPSCLYDLVTPSLN